MEKIKKHIIKYKTIYIPGMIASILSILAFFWFPSKGYDLYEYYNWTYNFTTFNFKDTLKYLLTNYEIISMLYFYIMSKVGVYQLIQVIPTFAFYFLAYYIIVDYSNIKKIPIKNTIFVSIILLSLYKYIFVIGAFRYSLAYMVFAFGLYLNYFKHKNNKLVWLLYILPVFIHSSTIILLAFRVLALIKNKKIKISLVIVGSLIALFPSVIINIIEFLPNFSFLYTIKTKIIYYFAQENIPLNLQYFFRIVQSLVLISLMFYCNIKNKDDENIKNYSKYVEIVCIIIIFNFSNYTLFSRLSDYIILLSMPYLLSLLSDIKGKHEKIVILAILTVLIIGGIRIQIPIFAQMYFSKVML
ncbi:MAG: EpsG family protein [Clostridia bacterium]